MSCSCGLLFKSSVESSKHSPVPLTGVSVEVQIVDLVAQVTVTQSYVNKETVPIEAIYLFPLDEGAGVCEFSAEVEGHHIVGVVKKAEDAKADYKNAIKSGQSAFMLKEKLPDVFKAKIGNLAPGSGAKIKLSYVTELKVDPEGDIRFYLPTTIAPRYVPENDKSSVAKDLASVTYTNESTYKMEFNACVTMGSAIKEIRSPTHKLSVNIDPVMPRKGKVNLENVVTRMNRDLVILIKVNDPNKPRFICQKSNNGTAALMLSIVPSFKLADQKTELIFIIDRSGSMMGEGIKQAKQALHLFLHSLPIDCYFNIVGFGSTYETLFAKSQKYSETTLATAKSHAYGLDANLGGTEILAPLNWVVNQPHIEGHFRQIFLLTDGEVSNANEVISLIRGESNKARVFALGLGSSASHHLIEGMARAGNGTALFATLNERLEKKVVQQLQDSLQPSLTDVKVKWDGYDVGGRQTIKETTGPVQTEKTLMGYGKPLHPAEAPDVPVEQLMAKFRQAPRTGSIPPVYDGRHTVVYTLLAEGAHIPQWAEITASSPDGPLSLRIELDGNLLENGLLVQRLAAMKLINLLQDDIGEYAYKVDEEKKNEIISLACHYGLASRFTSYVAVDSRVNEVLKDSWMTMKSRGVPLDVALGWGGLRYDGIGSAYASAGNTFSSGGLWFGCPSTSNAFSGASAGSEEEDEDDDMGFGVFYDGEDDDSDSADGIGDYGSALMACGPMTDSSGTASSVRKLAGIEMDTDDVENDSEDDNDKLIRLVSVQRFDGSFRLGCELAKLFKSTVDELKERGKQVANADDDIWATLLALAYLNNILTSLKESWLLVANKAEKWVESKAVPLVIRQEALKFLEERLNIKSGDE